VQSSGFSTRHTSKSCSWTRSVVLNTPHPRLQLEWHEEKHAKDTRSLQDTHTCIQSALEGSCRVGQVMGKSSEVMRLPVKEWEAVLTLVRRLEAVRDCVCTPEPPPMLSKRASFSSPSRPSLAADPCSHFRRDPLCARVVVALDMISKNILFVFSCSQASG
jgi:hypothetical protein